MNAIAQRINQATGRKWRKPDLAQPTLIDARDLVPLGEYRGRAWFASKRYGELATSNTLGERDEPAGGRLSPGPHDSGSADGRTATDARASRSRPGDRRPR